MRKELSIGEIRKKIAKRRKIYHKLWSIAMLLHFVAWVLLGIPVLLQYQNLLQNSMFRLGGIILLCSMIMTGIAGMFSVNVPYVVEMAVFDEIDHEEIKKLLEKLD